MENEDKVLETTEETVVESTVDEVEEGSEEAPKELTPEQLKGIKQRKLTKLAKELGVELAKPETKKLSTAKPKGFDYAEKAYLKVSGIEPDDFEMVYKARTALGLELEDVLADEFIQAKLKSNKEGRATKEAIPRSTGRSGGGNIKESVEYWLNKGELPPADQVDLRRKYVNEKIKRERSASHFGR